LITVFGPGAQGVAGVVTYAASNPPILTIDGAPTGGSSTPGTPLGQTWVSVARAAGCIRNPLTNVDHWGFD
jgi:hypothetical protein